MWRTMSVDKLIVRYIVGYYQKGCVTDNFLSPIFRLYLWSLDHVISWISGASLE